MLKKAITYQNLDGVTVTEDFYFNISKAEALEKAIAEGEGYEERLRALAKAEKGEEIIAEFKSVLGAAVGRREGNLFIKNDEIRNNFMFSGAYDAFFFELIQSPDSGASIISAMLPTGIQADVDKALAERGITPSATGSESNPSFTTNSSTLTASPPVLEALDGLTGDADAQAAKPQPDAFPTNLERAVSATAAGVATSTATGGGAAAASQGTDDEPVWLKENRYPTQKELLRMPQEELQLAMKMKSAHAFG
jgi:hypothetical protein